jgi:NitT/TauT family transport system permease protein
MNTALRIAAPFVLLVAAWWLIFATAGLPVQLLPSPLAVGIALTEQLLSQDFWLDLTISAARVTTGFLFSALLAIPVGLLMTWNKGFRDAYIPLNNYVRYLPVAALVPLLILWLGIGFSNKVAVIFIGTFFQLTIMVYDTFRQVPRGFVEGAKWLGARSAWDLIWRVIVPSRLPYVMDDLKVALGWAWSYLLIAEIVAATSGIGFKIIQAQRFLQTQQLIALVLVVGFIGVALDWSFDRLNRKLFHWRLLEDHQ